MLSKNDIIDLNIESLSGDGFGIGRHDGLVVFVPFTAKGDELRVRIVKVARSFAFGKIESFIHPSEMRIKPDCPNFEKCGGCSFLHIPYEEELKIKRASIEDAMKRIGKLDVETLPVLPSPSELRYRNKAQFPVGGEKGSLRTGFFAPRSHRIVFQDDCLLQPQSVNAVCKSCCDILSGFDLSPYDEQSGAGLIRHIVIRQNQAGELMVCLVVNGKNLFCEDDFAREITASHPQITSVVFNQNQSRGNAILGERCRTLSGDDYLRDELCGVPVRLSPLSFYQVNHGAAELLYKEIAGAAELTGDETLLDLYCGAGTIGLSLAGGFKKLIGVESVKPAVDDAKFNAKTMEIDNAEFLCADAGEAAEMLLDRNEKPDVIITDPPRKGCGEKTLSALVKLAPRRIVMVSCNPATLARDLAYLCGSGYEPQYVRPVDMFPRTEHVEAVAPLLRTEK